MIPSREIADTANEWRLAHNVVEKDYVLGWLLAGIARQLERQPVAHPFSDVGSDGAVDHVADVLCYSLPELLGEKLRALAERCRPRDLYDVVRIRGVSVERATFEPRYRVEF